VFSYTAISVGTTLHGSSQSVPVSRVSRCLRLPVCPAIDHNLYITKKQRKSDGKEVELAFLANYCSGLRIYDLSAVPERINEIAYFDVAPKCDEVEFAGSWSVYPYFESGSIIVSSIERGLFVLRHTE
jgi:choice-of-anchor B domain-containing protein